MCNNINQQTCIATTRFACRIIFLSCSIVSYIFGVVLSCSLFFSLYVLIAANASPNITVDAAVFNVTVGQINILRVSTFDQDKDIVTLSLNSTFPQGATWENSVFTWTPANMEPVNITYVIFCCIDSVYTGTTLTTTNISNDTTLRCMYQANKRTSHRASRQFILAQTISFWHIQSVILPSTISHVRWPHTSLKKLVCYLTTGFTTTM